MDYFCVCMCACTRVCDGEGWNEVVWVTECEWVWIVWQIIISAGRQAGRILIRMTEHTHKHAGS